MTKGIALKMAGLAGVMLVGITIASPGSNTAIGTLVPDSVADELKGGACDFTFTTSAENPIFCDSGECLTQKPNSWEEGAGTKGKGAVSCGTESGCSTYTGSTNCSE